METNKKYNLDKLTESHIDELIKEPNIKEMLTNIGVVPKVIDTGWFGNSISPNVMLYFENGKCLYGIDGIGNWSNENESLSFINKNFPTNPLQHLIKEAVKRGFVDGATIGNTENEHTEIIKNNPRFYFSEKENTLFVTVKDGDYSIFKDGVWSKVLSNQNQITVNNPQTVEYCQNGVFVPASVILDTPNDENLGEIVRKKFNDKKE